MPVKIGSTPGVMLKDVKVKIGVYSPECECHCCKKTAGYNQALSLQSEVCIGLNREKLALKITEAVAKYKDVDAMHISPGTKFLLMADLLIAAESTLIESKGRNGDRK